MAGPIHGESARHVQRSSDNRRERPERWSLFESSSRLNLSGKDRLRNPNVPLVQPSTASAILAARVILNIPVLSMLVTFVAWEFLPPFRIDGFAAPQRYSHLGSFFVFYYWGVSVGIACFIASMMLQAVGKRPHFRKEGISGTEPIFSWDALLELAIWSATPRLVHFHLHSALTTRRVLRVLQVHQCLPLLLPALTLRPMGPERMDQQPDDGHFLGRLRRTPDLAFRLLYH